MADSKSELEAENERLRALLADNDIDPEPKDSTYGVVGNFADLQRLGALSLAKGATNIDEAVVAPASVDDSGQG